MTDRCKAVEFRSKVTILDQKTYNFFYEKRNKNFCHCHCHCILIVCRVDIERETGQNMEYCQQDFGFTYCAVSLYLFSWSPSVFFHARWRYVKSLHFICSYHWLFIFEKPWQLSRYRIGLVSGRLQIQIWDWKVQVRLFPYFLLYVLSLSFWRDIQTQRP